MDQGQSTEPELRCSVCGRPIVTGSRSEVVLEWGRMEYRHLDCRIDGTTPWPPKMKSLEVQTK